MRRGGAPRLVVGAAVLTVALAACAPAEDDAVLTVLAASSLGGVLPVLTDGFTAAAPGTTVRATFGGSADLASQVAHGAPADVVLVADDATARLLAEAAPGAPAPTAVATNRLALVTPPDDPGDVATAEDLTRPDVDLVVCAPQVPCGRATEALADELGLTLTPRSEESSVTDVLGKVVHGEADAGVVYVTDARRAADDVRTVDLPDVAAARTTVWAVLLADGDADGLAERFVAHLGSPDARAVLAEAGFGLP